MLRKLKYQDQDRQDAEGSEESNRPGNGHFDKVKAQKQKYAMRQEQQQREEQEISLRAWKNRCGI
jgi:hypothetical protein